MAWFRWTICSGVVLLTGCGTEFHDLESGTYVPGDPDGCGVGGRLSSDGIIGGIVGKAQADYHDASTRTRTEVEYAKIGIEQ